jgi:hypothetical protein
MHLDRTAARHGHIARLHGQGPHRHGGLRGAVGYEEQTRAVTHPRGAKQEERRRHRGYAGEQLHGALHARTLEARAFGERRSESDGDGRSCRGTCASWTAVSSACRRSGERSSTYSAKRSSEVRRTSGSTSPRITAAAMSR